MPRPLAAAPAHPLHGPEALVRLGDALLRVNPADGTIASRVPALRAPEARRLANRAALAFGDWAARPGPARAAVLRRAAALFDAARGELGRLMQDEIGAAPDWQAFNLDQAIWQLRAAADLAECLDAPPAAAPVAGHHVFREPVGVCLGIAPWNAPLALGVRAVASVLACGNSVILKASELCPGSHLAIGRLLAEAGLPEGVLGIVTHAPEHAEEVVAALIGHDVVRRVNFTGSSRVGRQVAGIAARHLKRCLLALSGKASFLVLPDADLDAAARAAVYGAFLNQGQVCMSTDRVIVLEPVAEAFAARLAAETARRAARGATAPMVSEANARRLEEMIRAALAQGARLLAGGQREGRCLQPTLLDQVTPGMAIYAEELFGPVLTICRAETEAEAVSMANDSRYGLSTAVWGADLPHALALCRQIETGMCHVNAPTVIDRPDMPVGGMKDSGYGRFGGIAALEEFTELRWIAVGDPAAP